MVQFMNAVCVLAISALLIILLSLAYYLTGDHYSTATAVSLLYDDFPAAAGQVNAIRGGLGTQQNARQGVILLSWSNLNIAAEDYTRLEWAGDGLQERTDIHFIWSTKAEPGVIRELVLTHAGSKTGHVDLSTLAYWAGTIAAVGLKAYGEQAEPIIINVLELRKSIPTVRALIVQLWSDWTFFESWNQRAAHFITGSLPNAMFPRVPAVAAWVGLSALLWAGLGLARRQPLTLLPVTIFFLAGWLTLDVHWQWHLWQQLQLTRSQFAGKSWEDKQLAAYDGKLFQLVLDIKRKLPDKPVRLFLVSADPAGTSNYFNYLRNRTRYHLLPHNVYSSLSYPPNPQQTHKEDYVLILNPIQNIRYDAAEQVLKWGKGNSLPVRPVYSSPLGMLFQVQRSS
jgi:hypothetical protein